ncbi:MAG: VTT domain-containing protein [Deltaproteobacteria bacterium]|nr:VTT domain-containing protein [Deltaproteobacteria bacterium]
MAADDPPPIENAVIPATPVPLSRAINTRQLFLRGIVGLGLVMIGLGAIGYFLRGPVKAWSVVFVDKLGGLGVSLGFFLPDAFTFPIPPEPWMAAALIGGLPFWEIVLFGSAGSLIGGTCGYFFARQVAHTPWYQRTVLERYADMHKLIETYGTHALVVGALTPLPYSVAAWACGAISMPFSRFFAVSLLRIPRVIGYLALVKLGVVSLT